MLLVLNVPDEKNGFIAVKYESWHWPGDCWKTNGWQSINNNEGLQLLSSAAAAGEEANNSSNNSNSTTKTAALTTMQMQLSRFS